MDATGRNALYKIHVSLGKIVNGLGEKQARKSMMPDGRTSMTPEEKTVLEEEEEEEDGDKTEIRVKVEADSEDDDEGTIVGVQSLVKGSRDSLVDELLSDDDELR